MDLMSKNLIKQFSLQQNVNLNPLDPDYHIEEFWYSFKHSIINFYISIRKPYEHIHNWSSLLNSLKKEKKYLEIEKNILEFMGIYALELMKNKNTLYYDEILITNIKRWNKLSIKFNFSTSINHTKIIHLFFVIKEIKSDKNLINYLEGIINQIDKILETSDFDQFIKLGMENNKVKILDEIRKIPNYNFVSNLKRLYPKLEFNQNTKTIKICQIYKKTIPT